MNLFDGNDEKTVSSAFIEDWRYPRFFGTDIGDTAQIEGEDVRHIKNVLRMRPGDLSVLSDGAGYDYLGRVTGITDRGVTFEILDKRENLAEADIKLRLYQCIPKSDKAEFIVQKATELGATEIVPVYSKRCVSRPDEKSAGKKLLRYQKIALEAAKQCGRGRIPAVLPFIPFEKIFCDINEDFLGIIFYEKGGKTIREIIAGQSCRNISIIIGSEGGFEETEVALAEKSGYNIATLGKRILRCETAPVAAMSIIMNLTGNI